MISGIIVLVGLIIATFTFIGGEKMIAATATENNELISTKPALTSFIILMSESNSVVSLLQRRSMAVLIISVAMTKVIHRSTQSHSEEVIWR